MDVLVVGAGPVGMTVAALLHRAGVGVRVLERRTASSAHSRATTVHPRTLEVLDALPDPDGGERGTLASRLVGAGLPVPATHFATLPTPLSYDRLDTSYPFVLMCPQPVTEQVLRAHLEAEGVVVTTGCEVVAVTDDGTGVTVTDDGGRVHRARYLVGADGAHSVVRRAAGIGFPGSDATQTGFLADVLLDRPPSPAHRWDPDTGSVSALPLPGGRYRIFGVEPGDTGLTADQARARRQEPLGEPDLVAALHRIAGDDFGLREVLWTSRSSDTTRHADRFRAGRILLAGDAAHVHLPAGGQGLNVGIQDAANLAWKLAAEIAGRAPRAVVEGSASYDAERRPVARRLAANTLAQSAVMSTFTPAGAALRDLMSDLVAADGDTADTLRGWLSGLEVGYPAPGRPGDPWAGRRVPDLPLTTGSSLHRELHPDGFALVGTGATPATTGVRALRSARGWAGAGTVLVRPDGHAAAGWPRGADPADVAAAVAEWTDAGAGVAA